MVLATGGYASAPCALAAALSGVPLVVAEQNAVLGLGEPPGAAARRGRRRCRSPTPRCRAGCRGCVAGRGPAAALGRRRRGRDRQPGAGRDAGGRPGGRRRRRPAAARRARRPPPAGGLRRLARRRAPQPGRGRRLPALGAAGATWRSATCSATATGSARRAAGGRPPASAAALPAGRYEDDLPTCLAAADLVVARAGASTVAELTAVGRAQPARPAARRPRRPPDRQRPAAWRRRRRRGRAPTASSTGPAGGAGRRAAGRPGAGSSAWRRPPPASAGGTRPAPWPTSSWPTPAARLPAAPRGAAARDADRRHARHAASIDLARPQRIHVLGVGGAGMSAIASVLVAMGHEVSRQRPQGVARARAAASPRASRSRSATTPATSAPPTSSPRPPPCPSTTPRCGRPAARGIPVVRRAEILAAICADPPDAGGGRHRRQDDDLLDAGAGAGGGGPATQLHRRRRRQRDRRRRRCGTGATCWSWRPTRATAPSSSCRAGAAWSPTSRPTTSTTTATVDALRDAFGRFVAGIEGPRVVGIDLPWGAELAAAARAEGLEVRTFGQARRGRLPPRRPRARAGRRLASTCCAAARRWAASSCRCRVPTTPPTPPRPRRSPWRRAPTSPPPSGPWPATPAWPGGCSSGARPPG